MQYEILRVKSKGSTFVIYMISKNHISIALYSYYTWLLLSHIQIRHILGICSNLLHHTVAYLEHTQRSDLYSGLLETILFIAVPKHNG